MDLFIAFGIFLACVIVCMVGNFSLAWALLSGFICFFLVGLHKGFSCKQLLPMAIGGSKTSLVVQRIMILIGLLTGLWRASGTIAFFVHTGIELITPRSFILIAFLLPAILCMAFGSSFGVCGTAGIILMTIARSGDANLAATAGAILSGAYVGERLSPASSAAALVSAVSGVDQRAFQRKMWRTSPLPLALTLLIYGGLSLAFPIASVDAQILSALEAEFQLTWPTVLPALVLVALPWLHISAFWAIAASCLTSALVAVFVQGVNLNQLFSVCIFGYTAQQPQLTDILSGGGLISMISVVMIVFLSCAYSGLFSGTGMLDYYKEKAGQVAHRIGLFPAQALLTFVCAGIFCNQAVSIVMGAEILKKEYQAQGAPPMEMATNIGNATVNLVGMVPWCIACSVPLTTIGAGLEALPFAVYLFLLPLSHWLLGLRGSKVKTNCKLS